MPNCTCSVLQRVLHEWQACQNFLRHSQTNYTHSYLFCDRDQFDLTSVHVKNLKQEATKFAIRWCRFSGARREGHAQFFSYFTNTLFTLKSKKVSTLIIRLIYF